MILSLEGEYKSLNCFRSTDLEDLVVITGRNGSGKSQLIELIKNKADNSQAAKMISVTPDIRHIQFEGLTGSYMSTLNRDNWRMSVEEHARVYHGQDIRIRRLAKALLDHGVWTEALLATNNTEIIQNIEANLGMSFVELITEFNRHRNPSFSPSDQEQQNPEQYLKRVMEMFINLSNLRGTKRSYEIAKFVSEFRGKSFEQLEEVDFFQSSNVPENLLSEPRLFGARIESLFYHYAFRRHLNAFHYFEKTHDGVANQAIPDAVFIERFPPPWEAINRILHKHKLNYRFQGVERKNFSPDVYTNFPLIRISCGTQVDFEHLSSGEKVIIGLIIKLFTFAIYKEELVFPELLVLDEPDAHLHPEMSKLLIDVLSGTFVQEMGMKVILTTHSPSTVAFSPEESLYQLQNEPVTSLTRISKDEALRLLTTGVPSFSVTYENRRQVFVESPNDVQYYEKLYQKLSPYLIPEISLSFISSGDSRKDRHGSKVSSCSQVFNITNTLRKAGNHLVWGIIDWDTHNKDEEHVTVLGKGKRYSIENYLLDPILLASLLLHERIITREEIGLAPQETYADFRNFTSSRMQTIVDHVVTQVASALNISDPTNVRVRYVNELEIELPQWYLHHQGHELEELILKTFPQLHKIKRGKEEALKLEILHKIVDDIPELVSVDLLEVLQEVQQH